jgi:E3 ubiquitin-protein ligase HERC1
VGRRGNANPLAYEISTQPTSFSVTQALVDLLTTRKKSAHSNQSKIDETPKSLGSPSDPQVMNILHLANALSACILSAHLEPSHKQWASEQLVRSIAFCFVAIIILIFLQVKCIANSAEEYPIHYIKTKTMADLLGVLPNCPVSNLEGHGNRLNLLAWNEDRKYLASR